MKAVSLLLFSIIFLLMSCAQMEIADNKNALPTIKTGDSEAQVLDAAGRPDLRYDFSPGKFVYYYQTENDRTDNAYLDKKSLTAISFENGYVSMVGTDLMDKWKADALEKERQIKEAERKRLAAIKLAEEKERAEAERLSKIEALEKKVKPIPASNAALNLMLYQKLLALDPENPRYQKKVEHYQERLKAQKQIEEKRAKRVAYAKSQKGKDELRQKRNMTLRKYTGNENAKIAVHDMGSGWLYIWLKNTGKQTITSHPDYFTLLDRKKRPIQCSFEKNLEAVLEPGDIAHGKIKLEKDAHPKELIFENNEAGKIKKAFP